jgi:methyl-accepting chemotaxis protein
MTIPRQDTSPLGSAVVPLSGNQPLLEVSSGASEPLAASIGQTVRSPMTNRQARQRGVAKLLPHPWQAATPKSIGTKLFLAVMAGTLLGLGAMAYLFYSTLKAQSESEIRSILRAKTLLVNQQLAQAETLTRSTAATVIALQAQGETNTETYRSVLLEVFKRRPQAVVGLGFGQSAYGVLSTKQWFYPYYFIETSPENPGQRLPAPYNNIRYSGEDEPGDFYPESDYWKQYALPQREIWTDPYDWFDFPGSSFYLPLFNAQRQWLGTISADFDSTSFDALLQGSVIREAGFFAIVTESGSIVSYPRDTQKVVRLEKYTAIPNLSAVWPQLKQGRSGLVTADGDYWVYERIPTSNWLAIATVPQSVILGPVIAIAGIGTAAVGVLLAGIVGLFIRGLNRRLQPILEECGKFLPVTDARTQTQTRDEIEQLSTAFFNLQGQQRQLLQQRQAEAQRSRLLAELARADELELVLYLNQLLEDVRATLKGDRVVIYRFQPDWSGYIYAEAVQPGWPQALNETLADPCIPPELLEAYRQGRVVPTENVFQAGFHPDHLALMDRLHIQANLVVPITIRGALYGLLIAHHCAQPHHWEPGEINELSQVATQIGQVLERTELLRQSQTAQQQAEQARQQAEQVAIEQRSQKEGLQQQVLTLLNEVEAATQGDLTIRANITTGEIGTVADFFNAIIERLRQIVTQVKDSTLQVNQAIGADEEAIRQLADQALAQATNITHTLTSVEQMSRSIQDVAVNASQAAEVARVASNTARAGQDAADQTVLSIQTLQSVIASTTRKAQQLGESTQQISRVLSVINQFALQTNVLAVNAGIEAARAGEEGRGFTVVAQEVGQLAAQSATATKDIEAILIQFRRETQELVDAMQAETSRVAESQQAVDHVKQSLIQILDVSHQIDQLVQSISAVTISQAQTSQEVTQLMQAIAVVSQQTSESSRQVADSLQQTVGVAQTLQAAVEVFKIQTEA